MAFSEKLASSVRNSSSDLGENLLGLLRISESHHAVRIEGWEIQDRLPQANEDVFVADQTNLRRFTGTISSGIPI